MYGTTILRVYHVLTGLITVRLEYVIPRMKKTLFSMKLLRRQRPIYACSVERLWSSYVDVGVAVGVAAHSAESSALPRALSWSCTAGIINATSRRSKERGVLVVVARSVHQSACTV